MGRWRRALLLVLPALLALQAQWRVSLPSQLPTPTLSQFQVLLLERPRESFAKRCTAMAVVRGGPVLLPPTAGRVLLRFPCDAALASGDGLMVSGGRWQRVSEGVTPLLTSPRERFARRGIHWQVRAERVAPVAVSISPALRLRRHLQQRFNQWVSPPADQLLTSLLMGRRQSDLPSQLLQGVAALGLSHVVAASGYHLSILLAAGLVLLGGMPRQHAARRRGWRLLLAGVAVGSLFLALAGAQASVVRALAMAAMALWARSRRRRARSLLVLWMVLLVMLLLRPRWGLDLGFQFSALATLGLLLGAPRLQNWLGRWLPDRLAAALAVPLAANLFTLPLQLSSAGVIPWLAIPANLLLLPWFALLLSGAMALGLLAFLPLGALLAWPLARLLELLIQPLVAVLHWAAAAQPALLLPTGRLPAFSSLALVLALLLLFSRGEPAAQATGPGPWQGPAPQPAAGGRIQVPWALACCGAALVPLLQGLGPSIQRAEQGPLLLLGQWRGRAALVSASSAQWRCRQLLPLLRVRGGRRLDWLLLGAAPGSAATDCWRQLAGEVIDADQLPLPGDAIASAGLRLERLSGQAEVFGLSVGSRRTLVALNARARHWLMHHPRPDALSARWPWRAWAGQPPRMTTAAGEVAESG